MTAHHRDGVTRRDALRKAGAAGVGIAVGGTGIEALLARAAAAAPKASGTLKDIEHVVILIQENRSFDHYFGTYSGVRGFADKVGRGAFSQRDATGQTIQPFHMPTGCVPDLTHAWAHQHRSWNHGRMDRFVLEHEAVDPPGVGAETMGYHDSSDVPFYFALANAFTLCDGYHCSVMGPTDPNRLYSISGTLDPAGGHGGPLIQTLGGATRGQTAGKLTWTTMPEQLEARGISWKVYTSPTGVLDSVLPYFPPYQKGGKLYRKGVAPTYPQDFMADLASGRLPQVSWLLTSILQSEHPGFSSPLAGELAAQQIFEALVSSPKVWRRTALFITWDENGGFFDHVKPPTPPPGTKGEFLTVAQLPPAAAGIRGPVGLGFRVPMLVVSPFSRGGLVCSDTFDHTSMLRFLETRVGGGVPNLSAWRRRTTGDLTAAFNFAARPNYRRPSLPEPDGTGTGACSGLTPVPVPVQPFPTQASGRRRRPSGIAR